MVTLQEALKWADDNSRPEAVARIRSRKVAKLLAATVRSYAEWIQAEGERNNVCIYNVVGKVCGYCECKRKPANLNIDP